MSKALNGHGQLRAETRERRARRRRAAGLPAQRAGAEPAAQAQLHRRPDHDRQLSAASASRVLEGIENALEPARISVFLCDARDDPVRERRHVDALLAKRVDGIIVTGRRTDRRPPIDLGGAAMPVVYAFAQVDDPGHLPAARRPRRRPARRRAPDRPRPPAHRPRHRARSTSRRCASAADGYREALAAAGLRGLRRPMSWPAPGARPGAAQAAQHAARAGVRRSTPSSAAATRSRAASSTRCARRACACPTTSPSSASTTGTSLPRRPGRRSPRST